MGASRGLKVFIWTALIGVAVAALVLWVRPGRLEVAPDFALADTKGRTHRLAALRGKIVLVNLWTTWCPPCREEMPSMERLHARFKDRDVVLLAVSEDDAASREEVLKFVEEVGVTFPVLLDPDREVGSDYGVTGYPETFIVDRNGSVVEHVIGPRVWDSPAQIAALELLLTAPDAAGG